VFPAARPVNLAGLSDGVVNEVASNVFLPREPADLRILEVVHVAGTTNQFQILTSGLVFGTQLGQVLVLRLDLRIRLLLLRQKRFHLLGQRGDFLLGLVERREKPPLSASGLNHLAAELAAQLPKGSEFVRDSLGLLSPGHGTVLLLSEMLSAGHHLVQSSHGLSLVRLDQISRLFSIERRLGIGLCFRLSRKR